MSGQTPVATVRAGAVSAAIFENEVPANGKTITVLKATLQRRYKGKDGTWKSSNSYSRNEIPLAIHCLQQCFEKILSEEGSNSDEAAA